MEPVARTAGEHAGSGPKLAPRVIRSDSNRVGLHDDGLGAAPASKFCSSALGLGRQTCVERGAIDQDRMNAIASDRNRLPRRAPEARHIGGPENGVARQIELGERFDPHQSGAVDWCPDGVVFFEQQDVVTLLGQPLRRDRAGGTGADNHHVAQIGRSQKLLRSHIIGSFVDELYAGNIAIFISRDALAMGDASLEMDD